MPIPSLSIKKPEPLPAGEPYSSKVYIMKVAISAFSKTVFAPFEQDNNNKDNNETTVV